MNNFHEVTFVFTLLIWFSLSYAYLRNSDVRKSISLSKNSKEIENAVKIKKTNKKYFVRVQCTHPGRYDSSGYKNRFSYIKRTFVNITHFTYLYVY